MTEAGFFPISGQRLRISTAVVSPLDRCQNTRPPCGVFSSRSLFVAEEKQLKKYPLFPYNSHCGLCDRPIWKGGGLEGKGTIIYRDGGVYTGDIKNGKRDGGGSYKDLQGFSYTGQWKNDMRDGSGTAVFFDGKNIRASGWKIKCMEREPCMIRRARSSTKGNGRIISTSARRPRPFFFRGRIPIAG